MDQTSTDRIQLSVPAATSAVRIARAGAAGLATRAGFTYQEVEEVQLAVAEAAAVLAPDGEGQGTLVVTFDVEPDELVIDLALTGPDAATPPAAGAPAGAPVTLSDIAVAVLDAALDEWRVDPGGRRIVLRKRRQDVDLDED